MTDTERIDWLEEQGDGIALVHDDFGYWAVSNSGMQPVVEGPHTEPFDTQLVVFPEEWRPTIREAIDAAMASEEARK